MRDDRSYAEFVRRERDDRSLAQPSHAMRDDRSYAEFVRRERDDRSLAQPSHAMRDDRSYAEFVRREREARKPWPAQDRIERFPDRYDDEEDEEEFLDPDEHIVYADSRDMSKRERSWRKHFRPDHGRSRVSLGTVTYRRGSVTHGSPPRFGWRGDAPSDQEDEDMLPLEDEDEEDPVDLARRDLSLGGADDVQLQRSLRTNSKTHRELSLASSKPEASSSPFQPQEDTSVRSKARSKTISTRSQAPEVVAPVPPATEVVVSEDEVAVEVPSKPPSVREEPDSEDEKPTVPQLSFQILRKQFGMAPNDARRVLKAPRRSDVMNEDSFDFALVVRVALDAAQQRALEEAKLRADAIAAASAVDVGAGLAAPGLCRVIGESAAANHLASPQEVKSAESINRMERGERASEDSVSVSDSASVSDSDALSDSEDDFFGSSDSDIDLKDAGIHATRFVPRRRRFPRRSAAQQRPAEDKPEERSKQHLVVRIVEPPRPVPALDEEEQGGSHKCAEVLEALRRAGLRAKRVRSLNRSKWLIKVKAPEWRLEEEAERLRLRMRRRDGGWSKFRRSLRHAFGVPVPWEAPLEEQAMVASSRRSSIHLNVLRELQGSLFHSSDRQTLIHHILRCSSREGGAELGSHTPLGAYVIQMFPLHMKARLVALRNDWLAIWRPQQSVAEYDRIGPKTGPAQPGAAAQSFPEGITDEAVVSELPTLPTTPSQCRVGCCVMSCGTGTPAPRAPKRELTDKRCCDRVQDAGGKCCQFPPCALVCCVCRGMGRCARSSGRCCSGIIEQPLDRIAAYFGETVAFYFAWLQFYTQWLLLPAAVGMILFAAQVVYGTVDITWVPLFSLFMALWSTLFLEFWRRRNAQLAHRWGVLNYEHEEVTRPQFRGEWHRDKETGEVYRVYPTWKRCCKYMLTFPVILSCTAGVVIFMILLFTTRDAILVGIQTAACSRHEIPANSPMCSDDATDRLWQPAVDWGILSSAPRRPTNSSRMLLPHTDAFKAGSTVTAVLGDALGTWAVRRSVHAVGTAIMSVSAPLRQNRPAPRALSNSTTSGIGSAIQSLSSLGVESFDEWISNSGNLEWWLAMLLPPIAYGLLIPLFDYGFGRIALRFTDWENHKTESLFRNHRIAKVFSFRFVNSFISLFYYAFSPSSNLLQLTVQLASFLLAGQLWNTLLEVLCPCAWRKYQDCRFRQRVRRAVDSGLTEGRRGRRLLRHAKSEAWAEGRLAEYDTFNDYAEMLIQFGYVTFFSWAFPLAPLCALLNNVIEMRTDAYKLLYNTQRPIAHKAGGIGVWFHVLQGMSLLAVLTNCAHLALASKQFSIYFPHLSDAQKMLVVFLFEHLVLGLKLLLGSAIPHTSEKVQKRVARDNYMLARLQGRKSAA
jgi:hypothetical protein